MVVLALDLARSAQDRESMESFTSVRNIYTSSSGLLTCKLVGKQSDQQRPFRYAGKSSKAFGPLEKCS